MTIPTWAGEQNISSVNLLVQGKLYKFLNWHKNRPTQRVELSNELEEKNNKIISSQISPKNCFIILAKNESKARSAWEIGYQLFNMMLQAHVLNISYEAILLNKQQKDIFDNIGVSDAAAVLAISSDRGSKFL